MGATPARQWTKLFRLLAELAPDSIEPALEVFGGVAESRDRRIVALDKVIVRTERMMRLSAYCASHPGESDTLIYSACRVHRNDWQRWKRGELPDSSCMSQRIDRHLTQKSPTFSPTPPT